MSFLFVRPESKLHRDPWTVSASPSATMSRVTAGERIRFEGYLDEILTALGLDTSTEGTRATPSRLLGAWIDATSGYEADPRLVTTSTWRGSYERSASLRREFLQLCSRPR